MGAAPLASSGQIFIEHTDRAYLKFPNIDRVGDRIGGLPPADPNSEKWAAILFAE